jgi:hypothetical protein
VGFGTVEEFAWVFTSIFGEKILVFVKVLGLALFARGENDVVGDVCGWLVPYEFIHDHLGGFVWFFCELPPLFGVGGGVVGGGFSSENLLLERGVGLSGRLDR